MIELSGLLPDGYWQIVRVNRMGLEGWTGYGYEVRLNTDATNTRTISVNGDIFAAIKVLRFELNKLEGKL